jgi:hypothetical protein
MNDPEAGQKSIRSRSGNLLIAFFALLSGTVASYGGAPISIPAWWAELHHYDGVSDWSRYMTYTPAYFGPNALPVPEISSGQVVEKHLVELSTDVFWGFGDQTQSLSGRLTYVFLPRRLAVSAWGVMAEHYRTTEEVRNKRASLIEDAEETLLLGDWYISTQIGLLEESVRRPDLMLELIMKTASHRQTGGARYFDTPGTIFTLEGGKTFPLATPLLRSIRTSGEIGFLCYQMNSHHQNDAPLYGAKLHFNFGRSQVETSVGGYHGWTGEGDSPLVLRAKWSYDIQKAHYFMQYQHPFSDYPFYRFQTGITFDL